jgi:transposase
MVGGRLMENIISLPDKSLKQTLVENKKNSIIIHAESIRSTGRCPYCGKLSKRVHSHYKRVLYDLPIQGKKTIIILNNRKYFCENEKCNHKTFAEKFTFYKPKATKTNRLLDEIVEVSLMQSSISASNYLKKNVVAVGKSTICNLLKKTKQNLIKKP